MTPKRIVKLHFIIPLLAMFLLAGAVVMEKKGIMMTSRPALLGLLDNQAQGIAETAVGGTDFLILYNQEREAELPYAAVLADTLDELHIGYHVTDISKAPLPDLSSMDTLLYCSQSLLSLENDVSRLFDWVSSGGHLGFMMAPSTDDVFCIIYRKLGITEYAEENKNYTSLRYTTNLFPMWGNALYDGNGDLSDYTLPVRLETDCTVHIETSDGSRLPLLWEHKVGKGRIIVFNTSLSGSKSGRGFILSALFALEDTLAYPIINAGMVYIDDFPAPQPEGFNEALLKDYGYDIKGFYRNHWWPDMKKLTWKYGLRYTGVLVETYNDNVEVPFEPEKEADSILARFYASELLHSGGELGLHGYNHMPLCPIGFLYLDEPYVTWPSVQNMYESLRELIRYGKSIDPNADFLTYVPPSNYLSDTGLEALLKAVPGIKVISGLYLSETSRETYTQEFNEAGDGIVNMPRITAGFVPNDFSRMVLSQELLLHGVLSHFIHPDDILDDLRGATLGWDAMYDSFTSLVSAVIEAYPQIRFSTSLEGAAAVQRYARLSLAKEDDGKSLNLTLSPFYGEAWLALRTRETPDSVTGGEIYAITDGFYWIRADESVVKINWKAEL